MIPEPHHKTMAAIIAALEADNDSWEAVGINAGLIGTECQRALWYELHRTSPQETIDWKKRRIFERGNIEEDRLLALLVHAGITVSDQQKKVRGWDGHIRGKIDAVGRGFPESPDREHVVECKSSNAKAFKEIVKKGVKEAKPLHYATMQFYMQQTGLDRCLYIVSNKDNEDVHVEFVVRDLEMAESLVERARYVIQSEEPPPKLHEDPTAKAAFACKWCKHLSVCHENAWARVNCRTCLYSSPEIGGDAVWSCARWNKPLSLAEQAAGCDSHLFIPGLVAGEQIDADEENETVTYRLKDGSMWVDGAVK